MRRVILIAGLVLALAALPAAAQSKPDFSGEWKMNAAKSEFGPLPAPKTRTDKIEHKDPSMKIERAQTSEQGESTAEYKCTIDGPECEINLKGSPLKLKGVMKWDKETLAFDGKGTINENDFQLQEKWTLSSDAKTITVKRKLSSAMGEAEQTVVLEKQ